MALKEKDIKEYFLKMTKSIHAMTRKIQYENRNGCPDWLVAFTGRLYLVELKSGTGKLTHIQANERDRYTNKGVAVYILNSFDSVDDFIDYLVDE